MTTSRTKQIALFDKAILNNALKNSLRKLNPIHVAKIQ